MYVHIRIYMYMYVFTAMQCKIGNIAISRRVHLDWTALSNCCRFWSKPFLAIFSHFWACAVCCVLHKHLIHLRFSAFVILSLSLSYTVKGNRRISHAAASMSNIFRSLMGICFMLRVLFLENTVAGKNWLYKLFSFLARLFSNALTSCAWLD